MAVSALSGIVPITRHNNPALIRQAGPGPLEVNNSGIDGPGPTAQGNQQTRLEAIAAGGKAVQDLGRQYKFNNALLENSELKQASHNIAAGYRQDLDRYVPGKYNSVASQQITDPQLDVVA